MKLGEPTEERGDSEVPPDIDGMQVPDAERLKHRVSRISLKQWRLFHAVIDFDGFVGAANALHISQSSISHALAKLQDQLGISLLTIKGRKARITEAGKILLDQSKELVRHAAEVEELAENLRLGWEPEVRVAVAPNFPSDHLIAAFNTLSRLPRKVRLNVDEVDAEGIRQLMYADAVDLAIGTEMMLGFVCKKIAEVEYVAVAHPDNALFKLGREIGDEDLDSQYRIVFAGLEESPGPRRWKVNSLDSAAEALRHGLGYAWLPRHRVQGWLDDGQLRILPLSSGATHVTPMYLILGKSVTTGSCSQRFADALVSLADEDRARAMSTLPGPASVYEIRTRT